MITAYSDGACSPDGTGGWAWAVSETFWMAGPATDTTNQRMELQAAFEAMATLLPTSVLIVSDSSYVVNCFLQKWYKTWMTKGWKNAKKQPIANKDIWEPFLKMYLKNERVVNFQWVKGHSGNKMNDLVDELAVTAKKSQRGSFELDWDSIEDA